jgi:hypothetical protein
MRLSSYGFSTSFVLDCCCGSSGFDQVDGCRPACTRKGARSGACSRLQRSPIGAPPVSFFGRRSVRGSQPDLAVNRVFSNAPQGR